MKILVCLMFFVSLASNTMARDWYVIRNETNKCEKFSSPAELIEMLQSDKSVYEVKEIKEKGKLVEVKVLVYSDNMQVTYYTSMNACQQVLKKQQAEIEKYR